MPHLMAIGWSPRLSVAAQNRYRLVPTEPVLPGTVAVEDDLTAALRLSGFAAEANILRLLENSAEACVQRRP